MPPLIGGIIAGVLGLGGLEILGVSVATIIGTVVTGALVGAEMLLLRPRSQQPSWQSPPSPVPFEAQAQDLPPRFYTYGRDRNGGFFSFRKSDDFTLGYAIVINCRPIDAIEGYFVDDELLQLSTGSVRHQAIVGYLYSTETVDEGPDVFWPATGLKWAMFITYVWLNGQPTAIPNGYGPAGFIEFRNATAAGYASHLLNKYFGSGSYTEKQTGNVLYTGNHKNQGLSVIYSIWQAFAVGDRTKYYPRLFPVHSTEYRGNRVFDPRDPTQQFNDPATGAYSVYNSTWKWSANPALCIADFLTFPEGFGLSYDDINWQSVKAAADRCERVVTGFYGNEPWAEVHCTWTAAEERRDVLARLKAAADMDVYEDANGKICLRVIDWEVPSLTLSKADISSIEMEEYQAVYADQNYLAVSYVEPRVNFAKNTSTIVTDDTSIAAVGQRRGTLDLPCVHSFSQAYRVATRALRRRNTPLRITIVGGPRLLEAGMQRVVQVEAPDYGISGVFRPMSPAVAQDEAHYRLQLSMLTESMFDDVVPPYDPVNNALPNVTLVDSFTPLKPKFDVATATNTGTTGTLTCSVQAPNAMTPDIGVNPQLYQDTTSIARFWWREVDPSTHAALPGATWNIFTNAIGQYASSTEVTGVAGETHAYEVVAWLVSTLGVPGPFSNSTFLTISY